MKNLNYKTFIPALVAACILVYEASTGHKVSDSLGKQISDGVLSAFGVIGTIWGFIQNHRKG
jgi:hypothetical protein